MENGEQLSKRLTDVFTPLQVEVIREIVQEELAAMALGSAHGAVNTILDANKGAVVVIDTLIDKVEINGFDKDAMYAQFEQFFKKPKRGVRSLPPDDDPGWGQSPR